MLINSFLNLDLIDFKEKCLFTSKGINNDHAKIKRIGCEHNKWTKSQGNEKFIYLEKIANT